MVLIFKKSKYFPILSKKYVDSFSFPFTNLPDFKFLLPLCAISKEENTVVQKENRELRVQSLNI